MTIRNLTGPGIGRPRVQKIPGFYGERLIDGVVLKDITLYADERGFLLEVIRMNDNEMKASNIRQIIASYSELYDPDNVDEVRVHPLDNDIIPYNWECRME